MNHRSSTKEMVERVEWMSPIHYEILAFFEDHDIWISARGISKNIDYDRGYVSEECSTLVDAGILQKDGRIYGLTETGRQFLAGELDADDLESED